MAEKARSAANAAMQQRARGRPFAPGTSGNPRGRPAGSRPLALLKLDALAEAEAAAIVRQLIRDAKRGDGAAAAQLLARAWPPRRGRPVHLPELAATDTTAAFHATIAAVAGGRLTVEEGEALGRLLTARVQAIELAELGRRLEAIERMLGAEEETGP